jgi:Ni/Co efflux regulator RcnB
MKSSAIVCAIAAASLGLGSVSAFAQYDRNASNNPEIYQRTHPEDQTQRNLQSPRNVQNRGAYDARNYDGRLPETRRFNRNDSRYNGYGTYGNDNYGNDNYGEGRYYYGARGPEFRRGGYIPPEYRSRQYYVNDWRGHQLSAPPRGYQWVQVGADYALIALATGLIANLVLNQ